MLQKNKTVTNLKDNRRGEVSHSENYFVINDTFGE